MAHFAKYRFPSIYDFTRRNAAFLSAFVSLACLVPTGARADVVVSGNTITGGGSYSQEINTTGDLTVTPDAEQTITFENNVVTTGTLKQNGANLIFAAGTQNSFGSFFITNASVNGSKMVLNGEMSVNNFNMCDKWTVYADINDGAVLTVNNDFFINQSKNAQGIITQNGGTVNLNGTGDQLRLGHYTNTGYPSEYNLKAGTLNASNAVLNVAWDGHAKLNISGGTANLKGINLSASSGKGFLNLTGGTLNLGDSGVTSIVKTSYGTQPAPEIKLGTATVNAAASHTWADNLTVTLNSGTTTTFNADEGKTITIASVVQGTGAISKTGAGTLILCGSSLQASTVTSTAGTLVLGTPGNAMYIKPTSSLIANGGEVRVDGDVIFNDSSSYVICGGSWTGDGSVTVQGGYIRVNTLDFTNGITFDGGLILNNDNNAVLNADLTVIKDGSKIQAGWSKMLTFNGALKGSASLTVGKDSGWVRFSGDGSEYTGDLLVQGQMRVGGDGKDTSDASQVLGSGKIRLNGGTIQNNNNHFTIPNALEVLSESSLKSGWSENSTYTGAITGSGKLIVISDSGWVIMGTSSDDTFTGDVQCNWGSTSSMGKMRLAAEQPFGANAGTGYFYGQLDMNGYSQAFKGLYSNTDGSTLKGQIFNNTDKRSTLTLNITGKDLTYQGKIDGNIELIVNADGAGKQTLNNNQSTFTGNVVVNGGTLVASAGWKYVDTTVFGDYVSKTVTVNDGAELVFAAQDVVSNSGTNSPIQFIVNGGTIRNSGTVYNNLANTVFTDGAQLYAADGNATWKAYKLSSKVSVLRNADGSAADAVTFSSDLTKANATYSFGHGTSIYVEDVTSDSAAVTDTNSDLIISAVITNPNTESNRTFYKDGAGILEFTAANTFDGTASIREGVLRLTGDGTLGTSAVAIGEAGTLEIAYEDPAKNVDISSLALAEGGTFKLTSGTVSVDGAFSAGDGSQLVFELGGDTSDLLVLGSGSTLDISDDAVLELLLRDGVSGTYTLIEAENGFGDYADAAFWTDLLTTESDYFWNLSIVGNSLLATADPNVVPEPATWALLVLGISGICFIRRKNAK